MYNFRVKPLKFKKNKKGEYQIDISIGESVNLKITAETYDLTDGEIRWKFIIRDNSRDFDIGIYDDEKRTDKYYNYIRYGFNNLHEIENFINKFYISAMENYISHIVSNISNYVEWGNEYGNQEV